MRHYFAIRNRGRGQASVRDGIFHHVLGLDARYHDRVGAGELMSRASSDAELVARLLDSMGHTIGYVVTIFGVSIVLLVLDPVLALVVLVPLPFIGVRLLALLVALRRANTPAAGGARATRRRSSRRRWRACAS